jgi:hypothetical protein
VGGRRDHHTAAAAARRSQLHGLHVGRTGGEPRGRPAHEVRMCLHKTVCFSYLWYSRKKAVFRIRCCGTDPRLRAKIKLKFLSESEQGDFLLLSMYCIQHCFICCPSESTVSEDAGIELTLFLSGLFCTDSANIFINPRPACRETEKGGEGERDTDRTVKGCHPARIA